VKVTFSPAARDDLTEIALYIAQDNPNRALSFVDELENKCTALGTAPGIGTARPELGDGIRMFPYGRYLIFYRKGRLSVRIERILHGARDIGGDDFGSSPDEVTE
jgi:toxin ParE1/3/4